MLIRILVLKIFMEEVVIIFIFLQTIQYPGWTLSFSRIDGNILVFFDFNLCLCCLVLELGLTIRIR